MPLAFMPSDSGSWSLSGGIDLLLRDQVLADADEPFDNEGNLVPLASVRGGFAYLTPLRARPHPAAAVRPAPDGTS